MSSLPCPDNKAMLEQSGDTLVRRFEHHAVLHAEHIAVDVAGEQSSTRWTYRELNRRANRIAHAIVQRISETSPIALLVNTGALSAAAIMGTLKTGRVCVPIDTSYPKARVRQMIEDAGAQLLLADSLNLEAALGLAETGCTVFNLDELPFEDDASQEIHNLNLDIDPDSAAYLIYTSGSTGRPKGVIETHRNVLHHVEHYAQVLNYQPTDRIALLASCSVGQGMKTFCSVLQNGATLCPFDIKTRGIEALATWMVEERITVFISVPSVFRRLVRQTSTRSNFPALRLIRLGGETLHRQDVEDFQRSFSPHCQLVNSFSSTETGNIALFFMDKNSAIDSERVPVGFVSEEIKVRIIKDEGQEVGFDEVGEIAVQSAWLSPGYWRNPQLTQQVFQTEHSAHEQIYRTGDLGSLSRDGLLYHRGRKDSQVKIRGFRVELGEVEAALTGHAAIREAVVIAHPDTHGENSLKAFVVTKSAQEVDGRELRRFLVGKLPQHAIPTAFQCLESLPLTPNGKVDRAQLFLTDIHQKNNVVSDGVDYVSSLDDRVDARRDEIENRLAKIWMEVLQVPHVGRHDDFFELGGHSLLTVALLAQIEEEFSRDIAHSAMFGVATIAAQAELLHKNEAPSSTSHWPSIVALQPEGTRPPFFFVHDITDNVIRYRELIHCLGKDQPCYGLLPVKPSDESSTRSQEEARTLEEMAATYVRDLRAFQPHGDFYLCGHSFAGTLAFEIAHQLEAQGQQVAFLALLDTSCRADPAHLEQSELPLTRAQRQRNHRHIWRHLSRQDRLIYFSYYARERLALVRRRFALQTRSGKRDKLQHERMRRFMEKHDLNKKVSASYQVQHYGGRITLFRAMLDYCDERSPDLGWKPFAAEGVDVVEVSGNHDEMLHPPHVYLLARRFKRRLRQAQEQAQRPYS